MSLFSDAAGSTFANVAYNKLGGIGTTAQTAANTLANTLTERTKFQPFSISGPTSSASVDATGSITLDTGGLAGAAGDALLKGRPMFLANLLNNHPWPWRHHFG